MIKVTSQIRLAETLHAKIKAISVKAGASVNDTIVYYIEMGIWEYGGRVGNRPTLNVSRHKCSGLSKLDAAISKANSLPYFKGQTFQLAPVLREYVKRRDGFSCHYCGTKDNLGVDHIIPRSKGGTSDLDNLVACCRTCNSRKNNRILDDKDRSELREKALKSS